MEQVRSPRSFISIFLLFDLLLRVAGNAEVDALTALRLSLSDPNNVLQSWNATAGTPCSWFHVTCNNDEKVVRVDLGNAALSGKLVPQLGQLPNLQYFELFNNNITGGIPEELGVLTELVSLDLYMNNISGSIPSSLGNLKKLRFLIPRSLADVLSLQALDVSNNRLTGDILVTGSLLRFTAVSFANNDNLRLLPASSPSGKRTVTAIAIGAAVVLSAGGAIALAWWLRSKPHDSFSDVSATTKPWRENRRETETTMKR